MSTEFLISLAIIVVSAFILHLKSHVKFIALGLFIGLVLAERIGESVYGSLVTKFPAANGDYTLSIIQIGLLAVPALILGFNHVVDKQKWGLARTVLFVAVTTLFLLTSVISLLPLELRQEVIARSVILAQVVYFKLPLMIAVAVLIVADSFHHKEAVKSAKYRGRK